MKRCLTVVEGVQSALDLYEVSPKYEWEYIEGGANDYTDFIKLDGEIYPLFWWREISQISTLINGGVSCGTCSIKLNQSVKKSYGLNRLMYREFDIAEQISKSKINHITCFKNGNSANLIATMKNEIVATLELAACLNEETDDQGRRGLWGSNGMLSDRVVAHKVSGEEIYMFTEDNKNPETFTDLFIHMYGLSKNDVYKATYIARILMGQIDISNFIEDDKRLKLNVETAFESAKIEDRVYVKEVL